MKSTKNSTLTEVELCRERGWGVGTMLVGDEGYGPTVIRITALGESKMLACGVSHNGEAVDRGEGTWVLWCRDWREAVCCDKCASWVGETQEVGLSGAWLCAECRFVSDRSQQPAHNNGGVS